MPACVLKRALVVGLLTAVFLIITPQSSVRAEDFAYKFAPVPLEYASLVNSGWKPSIIFLVDNSPLTPAKYPRQIIGKILADEVITSKTDSGLAYLYADTHPFYTMKIPVEFLICVGSKIPTLLGGAATLPTGAAGITASAAALAPVFTECAPKIKNGYKFYLNSHFATQEVPLNNSGVNTPLIMASLAQAEANPPAGLPVITRRYYEITQEIRGMDPINSFKKWPPPDNDDAAASSNAVQILGQASGAINTILGALPDFGLGGGINNVLKLLAAAGNLGGNKIQSLFGVPQYQPLFKDAMPYRCSLPIVITVSSGVVSPAADAAKETSAAKQGGGSLLKNNPLAQLLEQITQAAKLPELEQLKPQFDFEPLQVPETDKLVRNRHFWWGGTYDFLDMPSYGFILIYDVAVITACKPGRCSNEHIYFSTWNAPKSWIGNNGTIVPNNGNILAENDKHPNHYTDYGLYFLSDLFDRTDLKTWNNNGRDKEGVDWDDPDYPHQTISTMTVVTPIDELGARSMATGSLLPKKLTSDIAYMYFGASLFADISNPRGMFTVDRKTYVYKNMGYEKKRKSPRVDKTNSLHQLERADGWPSPTVDETAERIKNIIKDFIGVNGFMAVRREGFSSAAPAVLNTTKPAVGVNARVNTDNWSGDLRFYRLTANSIGFESNTPGAPLEQDYMYGGIVGEQYVRADFGNLTDNSQGQSDRRVIVSTGDDKPEFLNQKESAFNQWLLRPSNIADNKIDKNLRNRCPDNSSDCPQRMLGDILNAPILAIDADPTARERGSDPYSDFIVTAANDGMVHIFTKTGNPLHPYRLTLDYLPAAAKRGDSTTIWQQLPNIAHPDYGKSMAHPHQYFINGGISYLGTVKKTCGQDDKAFICTPVPAQLFLVGGYGQGGRGLYALNLGGKDYSDDTPVALSNPEQTSWLTSVPLWESGSQQYGAAATDEATKNANQRLGYIIGNPVLANVALTRTRVNELNRMKPAAGGDIKYAVFAPNGFFSDDPVPTLYIFDALGVSKQESTSAQGMKTAAFTVDRNAAGKLIAAIATDNKSASVRSTLGPPTAVDVDGDEIADVVYAGDYDGNLWRFDLRKDGPENWTAHKIFAASLLSNVLSEQKNPARPITTPPVVYRLNKTGSRYVVMFGTGSDIFPEDLTDKNIQPQGIYGIFDDLDNDHPVAVDKNALLQQIMTPSLGYLRSVSHPRMVVTISSKPMAAHYKGWYVNLTNGFGERVVRPGVLIGGTAFFATRYYNNPWVMSSACVNPAAENAEGYLLGINPRTGGGLKRNMVNLNTFRERYLPPTKFISGFKLNEGVPSAPTYSSLGPDTLTNDSGQFQSGWENYAVTKMKDYGIGYLMLTSEKGISNEDYKVLSMKKPSYLRIKRINSREIF